MSHLQAAMIGHGAIMALPCLNIFICQILDLGDRSGATDNSWYSRVFRRSFVDNSSGRDLYAMIFSIDVECVAVGKDHNARSVAQISLVNQFEQVLLNLYVKQDKEVVSYLTPLTGITRETLDSHGIPLEQAILHLKRHLPKSAVLVGQNIAKDVEWLGLKDGEDFGQLMDLTGLFRIYNPQYKSYSVFSQDHLAKTLLQWDVSGAHDAVGDAIKSIRLFNLHQSVQSNQDAWKHICDKLLESSPEPSFAKRNPTFEGVCMGNRKTCTCGAPFFG